MLATKLMVFVKPEMTNRIYCARFIWL